MASRPHCRPQKYSFPLFSTHENNETDLNLMPTFHTEGDKNHFVWGVGKE